MGGRFMAVAATAFFSCLLILITTSVVQARYAAISYGPPPEVKAAILASPAPAPETQIWLSDSYKPGDPHLVSVVAGGDVMMGASNIALNPAIVPGVDAAKLIGPELAAIFRRADMSFVNLEGPLYDGNAPSAKDGCGRCYAFHSPTYYADVLASLRLSAVNLANNHSGDYGEAGRNATMAELKKRGIGFGGLDQDGARFASIALRDGRQAAVVGFAPNDGTLDINKIDEAAALVQSLKKTHVLVVVWFHGGGEGWDHARIPHGHEEYFGEDRGDVIAFAHAAIDAGADIVIGSGPHVPRALELYRGHLIAYSLGNFWTYDGVSVTQVRGLGPVLEAWIAPDGSVAGFTLHSTRQTGTGMPRLDAEDEAARYVYYLTAADFPDTAARIRAPVNPPPALASSSRVDGKTAEKNASAGD
jgi:poly-gamma-glutamate capsule biosynthesis protein CapA/YwtB (metallophosphatase superfamily)